MKSVLNFLLTVSLITLLSTSFSFADGGKDRGGGSLDKIYGPDSQEKLSISHSLVEIDKQLLRFVENLNRFVSYNYKHRTSGGPVSFPWNFSELHSFRKLLLIMETNLKNAGLDPDVIELADGSLMGTNDALFWFLEIFLVVDAPLLQRLKDSSARLNAMGECQTDASALNGQPYTPVCYNLEKGEYPSNKLVALAFHEYLRHFSNWVTHGDGKKNLLLYTQMNQHLFASVVSLIWPQVSKGVLDLGRCQLTKTSKGIRYIAWQEEFDPLQLVLNQVANSRVIQFSKEQHPELDKSFEIKTVTGSDHKMKFQIKLIPKPKRGGTSRSPVTGDPAQGYKFKTKLTLKRGKSHSDMDIATATRASAWADKNNESASNYDDTRIECFNISK